jgi:general secretion pathway protein E
VTGPTGSGKTTTLYAGLSEINESARNIMTIEDPVEYMLPGIGQTQVNTKVDMTFARGLRAILRQDPDVVMVGEIRDLETAEIAVQASLTGHLVLSTLHTNTAIGAVTRLQDMGVESFPVVLESHCRDGPAPCAYALSRLQGGRSPDAAGGGAAGAGRACRRHALPAGGLPRCNNSGYRGRSGIYELVDIDDELRALIHDGASEQAYDRAGQAELGEHPEGWSPAHPGRVIPACRKYCASPR